MSWRCIQRRLAASVRPQIPSVAPARHLASSAARQGQSAQPRNMTHFRRSHQSNPSTVLQKMQTGYSLRVSIYRTNLERPLDDRLRSRNDPAAHLRFLPPHLPAQVHPAILSIPRRAHPLRRSLGSPSRPPILARPRQLSVQSPHGHFRCRLPHPR